MSCWGKELITGEDQFQNWVTKTAEEILNDSCEDKEEITQMLLESRPERFPAVAIWVYHRRIHTAFVEWVFHTDFQLTGTVNSESPDSEKEEGGAK